MKALTYNCAEPGCDQIRIATSRYCGKHKQLHRNELVPCANPDCKSFALKGSSYCSKQCRDKVYYNKSRGAIAVKCAEPGCDENRHGRGQYCLGHCRHTGHRAKNKLSPSDVRYKESMNGVHKQKRGALVYYQECADPDRMPTYLAKQYLASGAFRPGDRVIMDGITIDITPRLVQTEKARQVELFKERR